MTCGIYKLEFPSIGVYIGQSVDIERRIGEHFLNLKSGKHTTKLLEAYTLVGLPKVTILQECHKDFLDYLESVWLSSQRLPILNTAKVPLVAGRQNRKSLKNGTINTSKSLLENV